MLVPAIHQVFSTVQNGENRAKNWRCVEKANTKARICVPRPIILIAPAGTLVVP